MKKLTLLTAILAGFCLTNCHGNQQGSADTDSIDTMAATENLDIEQPPQRDEFRFVASFTKNSDGQYDWIMVKGYVGNDESPYFEQDHWLIEPLDEDPSAEQEKWINDKTDIRCVFPKHRRARRATKSSLYTNNWKTVNWKSSKRRTSTAR